MADLESRKYDELEKVLAARPMLKAPDTLRVNVMARIAVLPQYPYPYPSLIVPAKYAAPLLNYASAQTQLENAAILIVEEKVVRQQRRLLVGFIFSGFWLGLCFLVVWLLWPALSNLIFGPSADPEMQARLAGLQSFWNDLSGFVGQFITNYGTLIPTILSLAIGLALMVAYLFGPGSRRNSFLYNKFM